MNEPKPLIPTRTVRCPACGGPSAYAPENRYRPFCSARCRGNDLGAWANEEFRIEARTDDPDGDAEPPPKPSVH